MLSPEMVEMGHLVLIQFAVPASSNVALYFGSWINYPNPGRDTKVRHFSLF